MSNERQRIDWDLVKRQLRDADVALESALNANPERIERAYRDRAIQNARRHTEAAATQRTLTVLVFSLDAERYGLPIANLAEVLPLMKVTPVPRAAAGLAGVINLRGELRSVVDLRSLLALPVAEDTRDGRILMLRNGKEEVGIKVGPVDKVQAIAEEYLSAPETRSLAAVSNFIQGLSPDNVIVLNTAALLSHPVFRSAAR